MIVGSQCRRKLSPLTVAFLASSGSPRCICSWCLFPFFGNEAEVWLTTFLLCFVSEDSVLMLSLNCLMKMLTGNSASKSSSSASTRPSTLQRRVCLIWEIRSCREWEHFEGIDGILQSLLIKFSFHESRLGPSPSSPCWCSVLKTFGLMVAFAQI